MRVSHLIFLSLLLSTSCREDAKSIDSDLISSDADGDGHNTQVDCDDNNAAIHPDADEACDGFDNDCDGEIDESDAIDASIWYADSDADGYGDAESTQTACSIPVDYVSNDLDCDDSDPRFHPGASEDDCTDPNDYNCDGSVGYEDADEDGSPACEDCDDGNPELNESSQEICDGVDNDCDGQIDEEDASDASTWYLDADEDGYGSSYLTVTACEQPFGFVENDDDCDDLSPVSYPGATEVCDGVDNDCDGTVDGADATGATIFYADSDGDGYGSPNYTIGACTLPAGYVTNSDDCDDLDSVIFPGASEVCDGVDNDCDGTVDEENPDSTSWYADADGDGYGSSLYTTKSCTQPSGYVDNAEDCNDLQPSAYPGAVETCDGFDNDCDGQIDDDDSDGVFGASTWYLDADSDGYGSSLSSTTTCDQPAGYVAEDTDCDDGNDAIYPGANEYCDTIDSDCDGDVAEDDSLDATIWYADTDADNYGDSLSSVAACSQPVNHVIDDTDCDDISVDVFPGAPEVCDGSDTDCDGIADESNGISACVFGGGEDGTVYITGISNIHTDVLGSNRSGIPDGVQVPVTAAPTTSTITVSDSSGFAAGDFAMLINLQGASGNVADVGNWEIISVASVPDPTTVVLSEAPQNTYSGSNFAEQKIVLQRVPQWTDVNITGTLTGNAWDGTSGGVLAFIATGEVNISGTLHMDQKGYRGGVGYIGDGWAADGEGRTGLGTAGDHNPNDCGGGGSYGYGSYINGNSGGGSYATRDTDTPGNQGGSSISGVSGDVIGDALLSQINFGGGAGGCLAQTGAPTDGGDGGGIVYIRANTLTVSGSLRSDGEDGRICSGGDPSNVSGGAGGAIYLIAETMTLDAGTVTAEGGSKFYNENNGYGGGGGEGRIRLEYSTLNTVAYPNTSAEEDAASPDPGSSATLSE